MYPFLQACAVMLHCATRFERDDYRVWSNRESSPGYAPLCAQERLAIASMAIIVAVTSMTTPCQPKA